MSKQNIQKNIIRHRDRKQDLQINRKKYLLTQPFEGR